MKRDFEILAGFSVENDLSSENIIKRITREFDHNIDDIKIQYSSCCEIEPKPEKTQADEQISSVVCTLDSYEYDVMKTVKGILEQPVNVYPMPDGTSAYANAGIIQDGYDDPYDAVRAAQRTIIKFAIDYLEKSMQYIENKNKK